MRERIFRKAFYFYRCELPLKCHACKKVIVEGEKIEITYHGKNVFCSECTSKNILVYPIRLIHKNTQNKKDNCILITKR